MFNWPYKHKVTKVSTAHWNTKTEFIYHVQLTLQSLLAFVLPLYMCDMTLSSSEKNLRKN